jgi:hypothetical protein
MQMLRRLERLRQGALSLGHALLVSAYLTPSSAAGSSSSAAPNGVSSRAGGACSDWQALLPGTPAARADALLAALAAASEHEPQQALGGDETLGFLRALNAAHRLDAAVLDALGQVRAYTGNSHVCSSCRSLNVCLAAEGLPVIGKTVHWDAAEHAKDALR